jgi:hypothetical protein
MRRMPSGNLYGRRKRKNKCAARPRLAISLVLQIALDVRHAEPRHQNGPKPVAMASQDILDAWHRTRTTLEHRPDKRRQILRRKPKNLSV